MPGATVKEVIVEMTKSRLGATAVVDDDNYILGIITDGDLRRMLEKNDSVNILKAKDIMSASPKYIVTDALAAEALDLMGKHNINQLLITKNEKYAGIIHLQDLVREGII